MLKAHNQLLIISSFYSFLGWEGERWCKLIFKAEKYIIGYKVNTNDKGEIFWYWEENKGKDRKCTSEQACWLACGLEWVESF
jgi:hypothetical protein